MKKFLALAVVLTLLVGGCASVMEFVGLAAEKVCSFSLEESSEAQMAMDFISNAAPIVGTLAGVTVTAAQAEAILNQVATAAQTGACVLLTDLKAALAYFDTLSAQYNKTVKAKAIKAKVVPTIASLRLRVK